MGQIDNIKALTATILTNGNAKFECGFVIPAKEIQFIVGNAHIVQPGDEVSFTINNITISSHIHIFECKCGIQTKRTW